MYDLFHLVHEKLWTQKVRKLTLLIIHSLPKNWRLNKPDLSTEWFKSIFNHSKYRRHMHTLTVFLCICATLTISVFYVSLSVNPHSSIYTENVLYQFIKSFKYIPDSSNPRKLLHLLQTHSALYTLWLSVTLNTGNGSIQKIKRLIN